MIRVGLTGRLTSKLWWPSLSSVSVFAGLLLKSPLVFAIVLSAGREVWANCFYNKLFEVWHTEVLYCTFETNNSLRKQTLLLQMRVAWTDNIIKSVNPLEIWQLYHNTRTAVFVFSYSCNSMFFAFVVFQIKKKRSKLNDAAILHIISVLSD